MSQSDSDYWKNHTCTMLCSHLRPENIDALIAFIHERDKERDKQLREQLVNELNKFTAKHDQPMRDEAIAAVEGVLGE